MVFPCGRNGLAARIGPCVAIVKVYHNSHTLGLGTLTHGDYFLLTACSGSYCPHTKTDIIYTLFLQYLQNVHLLTVLIKPLCAPTLHLWHETHIGTESKILVFVTIENTIGNGVSEATR